jgi:ComF family protein
MRALARDLLDLVLPPGCAGCARLVSRGAALCAACDRAIERIERGACCACQEAAAIAAGEACAACAGGARLLDACCAAAWFTGAGAAWVRRFKYAAPGLGGLDPGAEAVALALAREAAARIPGPAPDALIPVPQHPARVRRRGFQPAAILARALARELGSRFAPRALARVRDTPSQTGRSRAARLRNVSGCFALVHPPAAARVWLVDDVVTTGATLGEAARVLRRAGFARVGALCLARTPAARL